MIIGYARVSTEDQCLDLQIQALTQIGCERIYRDHGMSGGTQSRPGLNRALKALKKGDTLVVWRLDRLGRSLANMIRILEQLGKNQIAFRSITECIDTDSSGGRLIFHVMAALAEFERTLISERTRAGIAAAKVRGARFGRRPLLSDEQIRTAGGMMAKENSSLKELAASLGVHPRTLQRGLTRLTDTSGRSRVFEETKLT